MLFNIKDIAGFSDEFLNRINNEQTTALTKNRDRFDQDVIEIATASNKIVRAEIEFRRVKKKWANIGLQVEFGNTQPDKA